MDDAQCLQPWKKIAEKYDTFNIPQPLLFKHVSKQTEDKGHGMPLSPSTEWYHPIFSPRSYTGDEVSLKAQQLKEQSRNPSASLCLCWRQPHWSPEFILFLSYEEAFTEHISSPLMMAFHSLSKEMSNAMCGQ